MSRKVLIVAFFLSATLNSIQGFSIECQDSSQYAAKCPEWANNGECTKIPDFMKKHCKKSCNECSITSTPSENKDLDPHGKGKQCVDVSSYTFPTWLQEHRKCCKTVFKKHTFHREETVCHDVTALHCDVLPYTECEHKIFEEKVKETHWTYEFKPTYACKKTYEEIVHKKKKPVCTKKPKKVCNSKWEISPSGEKVWAGNEGCKTIYVDDCKVQEVPEVIKVEKPVCKQADPTPFITIVPQKEVKAIYKMECKVLKKVHCEAHTTKQCQTIEFTESEEKGHKICDPTSAHLPTTQLVHKKKCLLDHETYKS